jgi:hypothetical protein
MVSHQVACANGTTGNMYVDILNYRLYKIRLHILNWMVVSKENGHQYLFDRPGEPKSKSLPAAEPLFSTPTEVKILFANCWHPTTPPPPPAPTLRTHGLGGPHIQSRSSFPQEKQPGFIAYHLIISNSEMWSEWNLPSTFHMSSPCRDFA